MASLAVEAREPSFVNMIDPSEVAPAVNHSRNRIHPREVASSRTTVLGTFVTLEACLGEFLAELAIAI